jgi:hexosaminidase
MRNKNRIDLLPLPRTLQTTAGECVLPRTGVISLRDGRAADHLWTARRLRGALEEATRGPWGIYAGCIPGCSVTLALDTAIVAEGYRLTIEPGAVHVVGGDDAGLFYGTCTLIQLLQTRGGTLPALRIDDAPELAVRGVLLNVSRDKVPTRATLEGLIDLLAGWKINQVQLYTEHTFAYPGHEEV